MTCTVYGCRVRPWHVAGAPSPYRTTWDRLVDHTATRFEWLEPSAYQMMVFRAEQLGGDAGGCVQQGASAGGSCCVSCKNGARRAVTYTRTAGLSV